MEENKTGMSKALVPRSGIEDLQLPDAMFIHQKALCGKYLYISWVLKPVVFPINFILWHAFNYYQFSCLEEIDSELCYLQNHTAVTLLSCDKVLIRFYKIRKEITMCLHEKDRDDPLLSDPTRLSKFSFCLTSHPTWMNWTWNFRERVTKS